MAEQDLKTQIDRVRGSIIGGAVGDALGYQIEFHRGITPKQVTRFAGKKGIISDDTQMTLFTACGLLWRETRWNLRGIAALPHEAIYLAYLDWLNTQQRGSYTDRFDFTQKDAQHTSVSWIKNIHRLNMVRDPGMTCIDALSSMKMGTLGEPINDSKGCGGVMRIAPIALSLYGDAVGEVAAKSCATTHGHPFAILSAYVLSYIIHYASYDYPIEEATNIAIQKMNDWIAEGVNNKQKLIKIHYKDEKTVLTVLFKRAIELAKSDINDQDAIYELGEGWVAEEAVAIAIYCAIKYADDFENAIVAATNHDGDSDSTAAIVGNIVGAKVGYSKIPTYYKDNLELKDVMLELSDDLANGVPIDKNGKMPKQWLDKYLYLEYKSTEE